MNVYDFDGTIFYSDCAVGFALWCIKRHPKLLVTFMPGMIKTLILYKFGKVPNYRLQRKMFSYLTMIDDFDTRSRSTGINMRAGSPNGIWRKKSLMISL